MGRHARRVASDHRLAVIQVWQGFGSIAMAAAMLVIAFMGLGVSSGSGPVTTEAPLVVAREMQGLAITAATAVTVTRQLDQATGQIGR